jgi:hypothetical protein
MDVRGLLARFRSRVAARQSVRHSPTAAVGAAAGASALSAAQRAPRRASIASWLEDGRRLRLRVTRPERIVPGADVSPSTPRSNASRPRTGLPAVPSTPLPLAGPASAAPAAGEAVSESAAHVLASTSPTPAPSPLPPDILVDFSGDLSAETLAAIESMDATQRRLIFLRYLVRQGVYNEGFGERVLPEQYWHSRGVDGTASER